ncbi:MAG: protein translocase subunit SecDF [Bacteroidetes bacterium]|nr:MAG: protein translocase subunit SecDF [Bacteroidota bacterium]REK05175.1 MAG: protein translocase subunit SecDF [Bacteroidota bacterium]REK32580.1 MAG: protein translocase subunit SecDF [Bacteroidota bacterium]REK48973.1 MAG: protein translocase subunit SecDF [Bacteroidota bacterium]
MQSKGAIKLFAILLALVCLYQLSFIFVTRSVEKDAKEYANGDAERERAYLDSINTQPVYPILGITYKKCKENELNLGLDLKGGMNVTMEVSLVDLIRSMANNSNDPTFNTALENAVKAQANSQKDFVSLFVDEFKKLDPNAKLAAIFATKELQDRINFNSTNDQVKAVIQSEADAAFDRTYQILKTRIDKFGVTQPNVQKLGSGRILVELPGIKEPDRVRKLLQGTAKLEFWETYDNTEIYPILEEVNKVVKLVGEPGFQGAENQQIAANTSPRSDSLIASDTAAITNATQDTAKASSLMDQLSSAGSDTGATSDTSAAASFEEFAKENPLFAILQPSIQTNENNQSELRKGPVIGSAFVKDTARINSILAMDQVRSKFPREFKALWSVKAIDQEGKVVQLIAIRMPARDRMAPLDGSAVVDARKQKGQFTDNWEISMAMNAEGARVWKRLTRDNVNKSIAIVLDDYVYSYPNVIQEISGGNSSITGQFTLEEAEDLANILKVGKLPAPARIVEDTVVGPTLGQEAINAGFISFIIALILVLLFMISYYNTAGFVADLTLFANMFFIMGILASLGAVLTLPGIAGIVLVIGIAVDANILIFERVREELDAGKGTRLAINDGFKHAFSSIIDSNITTLILGVILYSFGTGPIQGFATTLIIGILSSLFSALFISRLIFEWLLGKNKPIHFSNNFSRGAFKNININFVGRRKMYYMISGTIIAIGLIFFFMKGLNFGVDFKGGRTYVVRFDKPVTTVEVMDALKNPLEKAPTVKTFGGSNQVKIITDYLIDENSQDAETMVVDKLNAGLTSMTGYTYEVMSSQKVGPTIADDIKTSAVWSILASCVLIFIFIFIRFKKWQFGLGAVVALMHDVLIVLSIFTIFNGILPFSLEIDTHFIAAILTVMGYSMTDTVVVFDRIREFVGVHHHARDQKRIINDALNATLSRTINTSLTIMFVLLAIFIFGGEVIRGFTFALLIGVIIGTYSSICIATPVVVDFAKKEKE